MDQDMLLQMLLKRVDLKGLIIEDVLVGMIFKKLDDLAAASDNSLDDVLLAMIKPELQKYLEGELVKKLDDLQAAE